MCSDVEDSAARSASDIARLDSTRLAGIVRPTTTAGVVAAMRAWRGAVCIAGARFSIFDGRLTMLNSQGEFADVDTEPTG